MDICNSIKPQRNAATVSGVKQRANGFHTLGITGESLVLDARAGLRPSQVEHKLLALLKNTLVPVSHMLTGGLSHGRGRR